MNVQGDEPLINTSTLPSPHSRLTPLTPPSPVHRHVEPLNTPHHSSHRSVKDNVGTELVTLSGHRAAVTALKFIEAGALLVSGSQDTDVIVWDVVAEAGVVRLHGHTGK